MTRMPSPAVTVLTKGQDRYSDWRFHLAIAILLSLLALVVRIDHLGFNSLSEDETAKWLAIQEYRHGHFVGVNSEHPMILKVMAWASLAVGDRWNEFASAHGWQTVGPESWLRLPNVILGAGTAGVLYLLCSRLMGLIGSFGAGLFWAVAPISVGLNRLVKEETPVVFFSLLACYLYCRAKQADTESGTRRWYDLSAIGFGLAFASQYVVQLFALNGLAWHLAGRAGLDRKPIGSKYPRFLLVIVFTFVLVNPVVLSTNNLSSIMQWLHYDGVRHTGYDFAGKLYVNFPSRFLAGMPWYYYLWLLTVKLPIPILAAVVVGSVLLLRRRPTLASCFFIAFGLVQLVSLSVCGAKWIRYSLLFLPFFFLAGGYSVQEASKWLTNRRVPMYILGAIAAVVFGWPLLELRAWSPYYPFYLNSIGGGPRNVARYFGPDETSEFDSREVALQVCAMAPNPVKLATARPMSMTYYVQSCGRPDIQIVPLYDPLYVPRKGDLIVLEPSRRFLETDRYFNLLEQSGMSCRQVQVGPLTASTIYRFEPTLTKAADKLPELPGSRVVVTRALNPNWTSHDLPRSWLSFLKWRQ